MEKSPINVNTVLTAIIIAIISGMATAYITVIKLQERIYVAEETISKMEDKIEKLDDKIDAVRFYSATRKSNNAQAKEGKITRGEK